MTADQSDGSLQVLVSQPPGGTTSGAGRQIAVAVTVIVLVVGVVISLLSKPPGPVRLPVRLLGLSRDYSPTAEQIASRFIRANKLPRLASPESAVYQDSSGPQLLLLAGSCPGASPCFVSTTFAQQALQLERAHGYSDAAAFPLGGGVMTCFTFAVLGASAIDCIWADQVTGGSAVFSTGFGSSLAGAAAKTRTLLAVIEH